MFFHVFFSFSECLSSSQCQDLAALNEKATPLPSEDPSNYPSMTKVSTSAFEPAMMVWYSGWFQNVSNECTANPITWSRTSRKQMLSESCFFCESIHIRDPSGELEARGALFPEIAFRPWSALRHVSRNRDPIWGFDMCCVLCERIWESFW